MDDLMDIEEWPFQKEREPNDNGFDRYEHLLYLIHDWAFLIFALPLMSCGIWAAGGIFIVSARWVLPIRSTKFTEKNKRKANQIQKQWQTNKARMTMMQISLEYGGENIGGDTGFIFLLVWIFWCILNFDGTGSERPSWPWLDWLG
jgi:hypothetical protein